MKTPLTPLTRKDTIAMIENENIRRTRKGNIAEMIADERNKINLKKTERVQASHLRKVLIENPDMKGKTRQLADGSVVFQPRVKGKFGKAISL